MPIEFADHIHECAFAFRGYNVTNLGRTYELLNHSTYGPTFARHLKHVSEICASAIHRPVDLIERVQSQTEATLEEYAEAVALVVGVELAQIEVLQEIHGVNFSKADHVFGYSLGEVAANVACGVFDVESILQVPLAFAADCAELAKGVTMGVLFSRGEALVVKRANQLCQLITSRGEGTIGISTVLSPNTVLLLGQGDTIQQFEKEMDAYLDGTFQIRINTNLWPPLHTPIVRQKNVTDRASVMLEKVPGGFNSPSPRILSLTTGEYSYDDLNARDIFRTWIDHPQQMWRAVYETLASGVETIIHVGPAPNMIPATFKRVSANVREQTNKSFSLRAVSKIAERPWLAALLPHRTALLRSPSIEHIILEDWLLETECP